ncbi:MAG: segregation and condensation protein A [Actinobacteria bacterium ADurb.Bin346]|nr:MAG: segregation and condensation protein A [Actinobacteria bacterium ADurb.Bin346]
METESFYFVRESPVEGQFISVLPDFLKNLNLESINEMASALLMKKDFQIDFSEIYLEESTTTIIDEMKRIQTLITEKKEITFAEITQRYELLIDKIICFLSILELYKNEYINIIQFENFGNIIIKRINNSGINNVL